jgi:ribonuclease HI
MADDMPRCAETIQVFADGSAMEGKVGAPATLIRAGKAPRTLHYHLGPAEKHTVHEAELVGIHLISTDQKGRTSTAIDVDNQAALNAFQSGLRHPGQRLAREALRITNRAQKRRGKKKYTLALRLVAGVEGVDGNEMADAEAKRAAQGEHSDTKILPVYLRKKLINPTRPQQSNRNIIEGLR